MTVSHAIGIFGIVVATVVAIFQSVIHQVVSNYFFSGSSPPAVIKFFISKPSITHPGQKVKLIWKTEYADKCQLEWMEGRGRRKYEVKPNSSYTVNPHIETRYVLTCFGSNNSSATDNLVVHVQQSEHPGNLYTYVSVVRVQNELDCNTMFTNDQKELKMHHTFKGKRIKLKKEVARVEAGDNKIYLTTEMTTTIGSIPKGVGPVAIYFERPPILKPRTELLLAELRVGDAPLFDCRIAGHCKDGFFWNGNILFEDCYIDSPR